MGNRMCRYFAGLIFLLLLAGCAGTTGKKAIKPGFEHFQVSTEQDGIIKSIGNSEITLKKKPFSIIVSFLEIRRIFVNASFTDESCTPAKEGAPLGGISRIRRNRHSRGT